MEQNVAQLSLFEKLLAWFETSKKQAAWGAAVAVVIVFVAALYFWRQGQKEVEASEALSRTMAGMATDPLKHAESADAYLKLAAEYPGTKAAGRALLQAAAGLFVEGKYTEAQAQFERFSKEHSDSQFVPQALLGVAACLDAQGKASEAAIAYEGLLKMHGQANVAPQAEFALARIYESQGKLQEAWMRYEKLAQSAGLNSSIGSEAGIRAEELRATMPEISTNLLPTAMVAPQISSTNTPAVTTNEP